MGCINNFCREHKSLREKLWIGERSYRWVKRPPAMAVGITDHRRNVNELLLFRLPLPAWQPVKHRGKRSHAEKALIARWCQ